MNYIRLKADIQVSGLSMGTWSFSGIKPWGATDGRKAELSVSLMKQMGTNADLFEDANGGHMY